MELLGSNLDEQRDRVSKNDLPRVYLAHWQNDFRQPAPINGTTRIKYYQTLFFDFNLSQSCNPHLIIHPLFLYFSGSIFTYTLMVRPKDKC
jgi:hypothetical protein